jgi:glutaryl-CoA dehydrogenase
MYPNSTNTAAKSNAIKYLPKASGKGELFGCFGLTEPNHRPIIPAATETHFEDKGDHYLLNGAKMWILRCSTR